LSDIDAILERIGDLGMVGAVVTDGIDTLIEAAKGSPLATANVARTLLTEKGQTGRAMSLCEQSLAMAPDDGEVRAIHAEVFSSDVGWFYFTTLLDEQRHAAYDRVLRRALGSGGRCWRSAPAPRCSP